jgi:hypothetical protein
MSESKSHTLSRLFLKTNGQVYSLDTFGVVRTLPAHHRCACTIVECRYFHKLTCADFSCISAMAVVGSAVVTASTDGLVKVGRSLKSNTV